MSSLQKFADLEKQANDFGFSWSNPTQILDQIKSECLEVEEALQKGDLDTLQDEIGDLIHATLSLCLFCELDPEETLEKSTLKFQKRLMETIRLAQQAGYETLNGQPISLLLDFWNQAKKRVG